MNRHYFDNASTTELHPKVKEKMVQLIQSDELYGNPSSLHT